MKEISGIATDSSTTDRPGIDAMCATVKKKKIWKLWKKHSLCPLFSLCEWKSTVAREYLYNTTNSSLKRCLHRQMLLRTLSLFAHIQPVSYDLFTPLNCPFMAPLKKIFHLCFFFSTQRLDQLQPYSESLSQPKQTVVCSTSFTLLWRRGLWAATSHSLHASSASGLNYFDKGTSKCVDGYVWNCMCVLEYLSSSFSTGSLPWHCDHIQTNYASLAFKM